MENLSVMLGFLIAADNPHALKEVDKAEDFDVNRSEVCILPTVQVNNYVMFQRGCLG